MRCAALALSALLWGVSAHAQSAARFALIIGVNTSLDKDVKPLRYADDDAARWQEFFRLLDASTWLMTRLDENTARLHPQAAAEAVEPIDRELDPLVARVAEAINAARARHVATELYVVYAGHGNVRDGTGYLALEDARLTTALLKARIFDRLTADRAHLIADACYSSFLASGRGAGAGARRAIESLSQSSGLDHVGLLLSTSSARESHEWEGFQAGVFSHELRSGLLGAADASGDGLISYREIAAFVERANERIVNEKYRPDIHAQPPPGGDVLVDIRRARERRLEIQGTEGAHYLLEDGRGVRLADFHNGVTQSVSLLRPSAGGTLYLRRVSDDHEFSVPAEPSVLSLAQLRGGAAKVGARGAANDAFSQAFALPFDQSNVLRWHPTSTLAPTNDSGLFRRWGAITAGSGALVLLGGVALTSLALVARDATKPTDSQGVAAATNQRISTFNTAAVALYVSGAVLGAVGVGLLTYSLSSGQDSMLQLTPTVAPGALGFSFAWSAKW